MSRGEWLEFFGVCCLSVAAYASVWPPLALVVWGVFLVVAGWSVDDGPPITKGDDE